ncbi:MAG: energy transducer TonB [Muribaculaceae bacterium]|nr:energy transducer TonB [Muribaculaceae bacterium]
MRKMFYLIILTCVGFIHISGCTHELTSTICERVEDQKIFYNPEQQPEYINGGIFGLVSDFYTILLHTAPVTQDCIKARAIVKFSISEDGIIDPNSIIIVRNKSVPEDYMNAAIEAIKNLGKFYPGKMNGTPIKVTLTLPVLYPVPLDKIRPRE